MKISSKIIIIPAALLSLGGSEAWGPDKKKVTLNDKRIRPRRPAEDSGLTDRLLAAKAASGKSWNDIAVELGLMNAYVCQLFLGQAQLKAGATADALQKAVPGISDEDIAAMQECPFRGFDSEILKEPNVYRTYEALTHYGEAIKMLINEACGDGIMSAIDFYLDVGTTIGSEGERRVIITMNGKFLPHIEQRAESTPFRGPRG